MIPHLLVLSFLFLRNVRYVTKDSEEYSMVHGVSCAFRKMELEIIKYFLLVTKF